VVSVEGEWGRGKSTFLNLIAAALQDRGEEDLSLVVYRPWHYDLRTFEDAWESIVELVGAELKKEKALQKKLDSLLGDLAENRWVRLLSRLGLPVLNLVLPGAAELTRETLAGAREYAQTPRLPQRRFTIFESVRAKLAEIARGRRIVLVIDDLDRCDPEVVGHVFRCLPTLFGSRSEGPNFVILMGMDRGAAARALAIANRWEEEYVNRYLEKVINVHITLPMLDVGEGDRRAAEGRIFDAIRGGGNRTERMVGLPGVPGCGATFCLPEEWTRVIARFMHHNPRELERFCVLFDLKWDSRFADNARAWKEATDAPDAASFQAWLDRFRDRLVWETIVELRWPLYDAKTSDSRANKQLIVNAVQGPPEADRADLNLPAARYLNDHDFLSIHQIYFHREWRRVPE
jgi:thymidylate kinase